MASITTVIFKLFILFQVTNKFLDFTYELYHTPMPHTKSFKQYDSKIMVANKTLDFHGPTMCESDGKDLSPSESTSEIIQCLYDVPIIRDYGAVPGCTPVTLADEDWYYLQFYYSASSFLGFYSFLLLLIAIHDISVICENLGDASQDWKDGWNKIRQCTNLATLVTTTLLLQILGIGCMIFTDTSGITSTFISRFEVANEILPCDCGCVVNQPIETGIGFSIVLHLFLYYMLVFLMNIKNTYNYNERMFTMSMPVPIEAGRFEVDEANFWYKVGSNVKNATNEKRILVQGSHDNSVDLQKDCCSYCPFRRCSDYHLSIASYKMYYASYILVMGVIMWDFQAYFLQVESRGNQKEDTIALWRIRIQILFSIIVFFVVMFHFATITVIGKEPFSSFVSAFFINAYYNANAYTTLAHIVGFGRIYEPEWTSPVWIFWWTFSSTVLFGFSLFTILAHKWYIQILEKKAPEFKKATSKLFHADKLQQNLIFFFLCGCPYFCKSRCECFLNRMMWEEGDREWTDKQYEFDSESQNTEVELTNNDGGSEHAS